MRINQAEMRNVYAMITLVTEIREIKVRLPATSPLYFLHPRLFNNDGTPSFMNSYSFNSIQIIGPYIFSFKRKCRLK